MTVLDLITRAMRLVGAISTGETPSAAEAQDSLDSLNDMLEAWSTERLAIYSITRSVYTIVSGTQRYTLGTGGTWDSVRPLRIENAGLVYKNPNPTVEVPLERLNDDEWAAKRVKDLTSNLPRQFWYNEGWPLGEFHLWPTPLDANDVALYVWTPLTQFSTLTDTVTFPPGYADAIRYNLAVRMAPEFGLEVPNLVVAYADAALTKIKAYNAPDYEMRVDPSLQRRKPRAPGIAQFYSGE